MRVERRALSARQRAELRRDGLLAKDEDEEEDEVKDEFATPEKAKRVEEEEEEKL